MKRRTDKDRKRDWDEERKKERKERMNSNDYDTASNNFIIIITVKYLYLIFKLFRSYGWQEIILRGHANIDK